MALNPLNSSSLEQLALKGLIIRMTSTCCRLTLLDHCYSQ